MTEDVIETMAMVSYSVDRPTTLEPVLVDPPLAGEVRVKVSACAICHSDVFFMDGQWGGFEPSIFGHEAAGTVTDVGEGVSRVRVGDPVVVTLIRWCGSCFFCLRGEATFCAGGFALDHSTRVHTVGGASLMQGLKVGGFAGYVVVHQSQVVGLPQSIPLDSASLLACGVLTGVGAVRRTAGVGKGASVVVVGVGGVGLNAIQGARLVGAEPIVAVDLARSKLEIALRFGATHVAEPNAAMPIVADLTQGRGADYVFVAAGSGRAIDTGMSLMRKGGTLVVVGMPPTGVSTNLELGDIAGFGQSIVGSKMGSAVPDVDIPDLVDLAADGSIELDGLISGRYPLEKIDEAIETVKSGEAVRNVIMFY